MPFQAVTFRVLIASPSDLSEERSAAVEAVHEWNADHAADEGVVLLPVMWEAHASPQSGIRPQEAINQQLVRDCDVLVAMFWTKLGTDTGIAPSGTVEEIDQFVAAAKPASIYFSRRRVDPSQLDLRQLRRLRDFQAATYQTALTRSFGTVEELRRLLARDLMRKVRDLKVSRPEGRADRVPVADEAWQRLLTERDALQQQIAELQTPGLEFFFTADVPPFHQAYPKDAPPQEVLRIGVRTTSPVRSVNGVRVRVETYSGDPGVYVDTVEHLDFMGGAQPSGQDVNPGHPVYAELLVIRDLLGAGHPQVFVHYVNMGVTPTLHQPLPPGAWELTVIASGNGVPPARAHFSLTVSDDPTDRVRLRLVSTRRRPRSRSS